MNKEYALGLDVGGTHITVAVIAINKMKVLDFSLHIESFDSNLPVAEVMDIWEKAIRTSWKNSGIEKLEGLAICMPGPFDYASGICWIKGQAKYEHFYSLNIRELIQERLNLSNDLPILFDNDANCFGKGEFFKNAENISKKVMAVTLGTGLGASFIDNGKAIDSGTQVPTDGELYNIPFKQGIAEDYVSARGLLFRYEAVSGIKISNGLELFNRANDGDVLAIKVFEEVGEDLAEIVIPWLRSFKADSFIIGGKIANASVYFLPAFQQKIKNAGSEVTVLVSTDNEIAALLGAVSLLCKM
ncbi:ROK family protein [Flavobacterium gawalongense]|uniref:ROK family protein n=1 Tax=Flavobacterium gawalongense TaxID=2594432 RepID=A0A553BEH4_9FLAO|nr:ROK family protein [Flavobacterium gawalongense]TRW98978.1 ROK family protein [Flavobacterium gawalongense]TRX03546.1 ROK family protein [Flavobacterium gawalongense]TRX06622.1 ROK family protein [Flavobacterium gawalongense]TRX08550.1 ROK family protein [Flavobacterium gawalongense]TRX24878.1 ROK family protein [Flavobacterium gawalongense]